MIKKLIFLIEFPFNQRDYNRFGIEILKKNGFEVEVWDFTPFLHPKVYREVKVPDPINWKNCFSFLTLNNAQSAISGLTQNCFIVCMIGYQFNSFPVFLAISKTKIPYCVFMANALPSINNKKGLADLSDMLKSISPTKIINKLFIHIPYRCIGILPAAMILAGGAKSTNSNYPLSNKTETLWLHTLDYDIYLNESHNPAISESKTGVFLDEFVPFHPDNIYFGLSASITPEEYYPGLCKFFDLIEDQIGVRIVVAAHPRSNYEKRPDYFNGRSVIKGKTAELVRKSRIVLSHMSTSVNFAVLFHKPVIYITSDWLQQSIWGPYIELMASQLGKKEINIDYALEINWEKELSINEEAYMNYKDSYIKKAGSDELPFWQIFANRIKLIT